MIITLAKPKVDYTEILCGGYTEQRTLSNEDKVLFRKVMGETSFISKVQYGNGGPEMKVIIDNEAAKSIIR